MTMAKRPTTRRLALLLVLLFAFQWNMAMISGLKDCIEPIRNASSCGPEYALVPEKICHIDDDTVSCGSSARHEGSEACAVVVEALFAEWRMMDAALLTSGSCHASIEQGQFFAQDALRMFPANPELVAVRVDGKRLVKTLEHGLVDYYQGSNSNAYPHTAGLKYELDLRNPSGQRIQNVQVMGFMCNWKPLNEDQSYMVLTDSALAQTLFPNAKVTRTGRGSAESFFLYATSVCTVRNNWHKMRPKLAPSSPDERTSGSRIYPLPATMSSSPPSPNPLAHHSSTKSKRRTISATH